MVAALLDTNILIDHLRAIPQARDVVRHYTSKSISIVSWIEVMVGAASEEGITRDFLDTFVKINMDHEIAERAVDLRRRYRVKFPDAVIWATAQANALILVTRNTKDFPSEDPSVHVPYVLP